MTDINVYIAEARRKDMLRQAEQEREAGEFARMNRRGNPTLAWVGRRLTRAGSQLIELAEPRP